MAQYEKIMVVDDNPAILTAVKICLAEVFGNVVTLSTPEGMVAKVGDEQPEAVLLDMNFGPGVNSGQEGLVWLRALRKHHPNVPVVLMTAYADVHLAVRGLKAGAADFVTKPWDNDDLVRTLRDAIEKNKSVVPLDLLEAQHVKRVVDTYKGNISKAAEMLGITRQTLYTKLRALDR